MTTFYSHHTGHPQPARRTSPDTVWPLRGADGLTWAERKALQQQKKKDA